MRLTPNEIKRARLLLGTTQAELAHRMDTTTQTVKAWEAGRRRCTGPAAVLLELLCRTARGGVEVGHRPKYADLAAEDWAAAAAYDRVEPKYDGWFGKLVCSAVGWELYNRRGTLMLEGAGELPSCILNVEIIDHTEWAVHEAPEELRGKLVVWSVRDAVGGHGARDELLALVASIAGAGVPVVAGKSWPARLARHRWKRLVERDGFEGLVFRTADGQGFARMKARESMDYVCAGLEYDFAEDVCTLVGALYTRQGRLSERVRVPLLSAAQREAATAERESLVGRVFEASGLRVTRAQSLRNPRFDRWRDDKSPADCRVIVA